MHCKDVVDCSWANISFKEHNPQILEFLNVEIIVLLDWTSYKDYRLSYEESIETVSIKYLQNVLLNFNKPADDWLSAAFLSRAIANCPTMGGWKMTIRMSCSFDAGQSCLTKFVIASSILEAMFATDLPWHPLILINVDTMMVLWYMWLISLK